MDYQLSIQELSYQRLQGVDLEDLIKQQQETVKSTYKSNTNVYNFCLRVTTVVKLNKRDRNLKNKICFLIRYE